MTSAVGRAGWGMGLLAALVVAGAGCKRESQEPKGSGLQPIRETGLRSAQPEVPPDPASRPPAPAVAAPADDVAPVAPPPSAPKIEIGMSRDDFAARTEGCVERRVFIPGGSKRKLVEVFQTVPGECVKKLGERRFTLVELKLESIEAGLLPPEAPPSEPRSDR